MTDDELVRLAVSIATAWVETEDPAAMARAMLMIALFLGKSAGIARETALEGICRIYPTH